MKNLKRKVLRFFNETRFNLFPAVAKNYSGDVEIRPLKVFLPRIVIVFTLFEYGTTINDALIISVLKFLYAKNYIYIRFYTHDKCVCVFLYIFFERERRQSRKQIF